MSEAAAAARACPALLLLALSDPPCAHLVAAPTPLLKPGMLTLNLRPEHCTLPCSSQAGAKDAGAGQKEYDLLFEDAIDFIKSGIMTGEGDLDFDTAEKAKEKETKVSRAALG